MDWIAFGTWLAVAYCAAFAFVGAALALRRYRRAAPLTVAAALFFAFAGSVAAQKGGGTNSPPRLAARPLRTAAQTPRGVSAAPAKVAKINARGAWRDSFLLDFGDGFLFPFGTNRLSSVEIFTQGYARPRRRSADFVVDTGLRAAIVPGVSSLAAELTPSNSWRVAWTDAAQNRDTNALVSASIELMQNGDVAVTTNGVTRTIPRVHPHDLDGDGIPDPLDANPGVCDGDFFGPQGALPPGANTNAYCWVDLVVHDADAEVVFSGDGYSDLADPHFMARAEATNRVTILIGKGYDVTCDEAVECVGVSDEAVEVWNYNERSLHVRWPVIIDYIDGDEPQRGGSLLRSRGAALRGNGAPDGLSRRMRVVPDWLGGEFEWTTNRCCELSMSGFSLLWNCGGDCGCGGCEAHGDYVYEGYRLYAFGGLCGCVPPLDDPDPVQPGPGVSVSFSEDALFYEEAYTNAPGDVVGRRVSTNATFACTAYGGERGGTLTLSTVNFEKLQKTGGDELPQGSVELAPRETRTWTAQYAPLAHSDAADDVTATAVFAETLSGEALSAEASLTVVELEIVADALFPENRRRHVFGPQETVLMAVQPQVDGITWHIADTNTSAASCIYKAPDEPTSELVRVELNSVVFSFCMTVIPPTNLAMVEYEIATTNDWLAKTGSVPGPGDLAAGLTTSLKVMPETVSFAHLYLMEGVCDATNAWGIFAPYSDVLLPHDELGGALTEVPVGDLGNFAGTDVALVAFSSIGIEWAAGGFQYDIPNYWFVKGDDGTPGRRHLFSTVSQVVTFSPDGSLSIEKYGCIATRGTNGVSFVERR